MQGNSGAEVYLTEWILERKSLQYSSKKPVFIDRGDGVFEGIEPKVIITKHRPPKLTPETGVAADASLTR